RSPRAGRRGHRERGSPRARRSHAPSWSRPSRSAIGIPSSYRRAGNLRARPSSECDVAASRTRDGDDASYPICSWKSANSYRSRHLGSLLNHVDGGRSMRLRTLGRSGLRVSELCLGAMTFGTAGWGCDEKTALDLIARFLDAGGNFIDTADIYADGRAEG